jgi:hypothetical protein
MLIISLQISFCLVATIQQTFAIPIQSASEDELYSDFSLYFPTPSETPWHDDNIFFANDGVVSIDADDTALLE